MLQQSVFPANFVVPTMAEAYLFPAGGARLNHARGHMALAASLIPASGSRIIVNKCTPFEQNSKLCHALS
jgi:hypothetical protein